MVRPKIGSNAIFSGPQKGLTTIGSHCYAYSGEIIVTNGANSTMLEFTTGKHYIVSKFNFGTGDSQISGSQNIGYQISFNGNIIFSQFSESDSDGTLIYDGASLPVEILIPPLTAVTIEGFTSDTDNLKCFSMLQGTVYA